MSVVYQGERGALGGAYQLVGSTWRWWFGDTLGGEACDETTAREEAMRRVLASDYPEPK